MRRNKIYLLLLSLGLAIGVIFALSKAKASSPTSSTGAPAATVVYDEYWKATEALVSTTTGFRYFYPYGSPTSYPLPAAPINQRTNTAGIIGTDGATGGSIITLFPKMAVTKWKVHGHIHFTE